MNRPIMSFSPTSLLAILLMWSHLWGFVYAQSTAIPASSTVSSAIASATPNTTITFQSIPTLTTCQTYRCVPCVLRLCFANDAGYSGRPLAMWTTTIFRYTPSARKATSRLLHPPPLLRQHRLPRRLRPQAWRSSGSVLRETKSIRISQLSLRMPAATTSSSIFHSAGTISTAGWTMTKGPARILSCSG